jgi:hypothetical protein
MSVYAMGFMRVFRGYSIASHNVFPMRYWL